MIRPECTRIDNQRSSRLNTPGFSTTPVGDRSTSIKSLLSGQTLSQDEFTHNNMVPFFGGNIKQSIDPGATKSILDQYTGHTHDTTVKKEQTPFFQMCKDNSFIHGTPIQTQKERDRMVPSREIKQELPFKQIKVGPGLNQGYNAKPSDGYQPIADRQFELPKTTNELRTVNNPKCSYKGVVIQGKSTIDKPQRLPENFVKRTPDRFFKNTPDRYQTTIGAITKPQRRSTPIVRETNRQQSKEVRGGAGPTTGSKELPSEDRPKVQETHKRLLKTDEMRNLDGSNQWKDVDKGDYGKKGLFLGPNERDTTTGKNVVHNLTTIVKDIVAPLQDMLRFSRKEITAEQSHIGNPEQTTSSQIAYDPCDKPATTMKELGLYSSKGGSLSATATYKNTVYDPNDVARTTIRETTSDALPEGPLRGKACVQVYDPDDVAKPTIKETTIEAPREGFMTRTERKGPVFDPQEKAKTTIKETTVQPSRTGEMGLATLAGNSTLRNPDEVARTTLKETSIHHTREGDVSMPSRFTAYDPNDIAKPTIKETNIHNNHTGSMGMSLPRSTVYDPNDILRTTTRQTTMTEDRIGNIESGSTQAGFVQDPSDTTRTTTKETTIDNDYDGALKGPVKPITYDPNDILRTTTKETNIHNNHTGNIQLDRQKTVVRDPCDVPNTTTRETLPETDKNVNIAGEVSGQVRDPDDCAKTTVKETTLTSDKPMNPDGHAGGGDSGGGGYETTNVEAPTTNREFTSDHEYAGIADGQVLGGDGDGYLAANPEAPETNRQFTSDNEYSGTAYGGESKQVSYEDVYNATLNEVKQEILLDRRPAPSGPKETIGATDVNVETKRLLGDEINQREVVQDAVHNPIPDKSLLGEVQQKDPLCNQDILDRTDPDILDAFRNNPYTHSLNSV